MVNELHNTVTRNLLKYAAGAAITYPCCGDIADWRKTVLVGSKTVCTSCFARAMEGIVSRHGSERAKIILADKDITSRRDIHVTPTGIEYGKVQL